MPSVLRHRDFRLLWAGQAFSTLGDRLVLVALALFVDEIGTPTDVGLVLAAHYAPFVLFLLIGGVWADRLPRHLLMVGTDVVRFALHALLAVLIFTGVVEVWHVIVIEALFGTAEAFFRPAYTGLLPQTVPEEEIQAAYSVTSLTVNVTSFAGPALATALVLGLGAGWAFMVDALTFVASAALLIRVRPRERGERGERTGMLRELGEGWRAVRENAWVLMVVVGAMVVLLTAYGPFLTLGPSIAEELHGSRGYYGVMVTILGLGSLVGSLAVLRWRPRYPLRFCQFAILPYGPAIAAYALDLHLVAVGFGFAAAGFGIGAFGVLWETTLAEKIPPHLLSRVGAFDWMGSSALMPVGYALAGPLGEAVGATELLVVGGALTLLAELWILSRPSVWGLRSGRPASVVDASA